MVEYNMFAVCQCGEQIIRTGGYSSVYYDVRQWQNHHEALGHKLISSEDNPEEYYRLYASALGIYGTALYTNFRY